MLKETTGYAISYDQLYTGTISPINKNLAFHGFDDKVDDEFT